MFASYALRAWASTLSDTGRRFPGVTWGALADGTRWYRHSGSRDASASRASFLPSADNFSTSREMFILSNPLSGSGPASPGSAG
ncbi:hypothetical protein ACN28S_36250 [Cystobacter fuscus]